MQLFAKQPGVVPHRFESCTFRQFYATLAQWIVQRNSSPFDAGSSPVCRSSFLTITEQVMQTFLVISVVSFACSVEWIVESCAKLF